MYKSTVPVGSCSNIVLVPKAIYTVRDIYKSTVLLPRKFCSERHIHLSHQFQDCSTVLTFILYLDIEF